MKLQNVISKCRELQRNGHSVHFSISFDEVSVEHRRALDRKLLARFTSSEFENENLLSIVFKYLDDIGREEIR